MGVKVESSPEQCEAMRKLDPFFLQAISSKDGTLPFSVVSIESSGSRPIRQSVLLNLADRDFAVLDAPGNGDTDTYGWQMVTSWPVKPGFPDNPSPIVPPETSEERRKLVRTFARTWAQTFRSFVESFPEDTEVKALELADWPPPRGLRTKDRLLLIGDALHAMAMCACDRRSRPWTDEVDR